jgi:LysM repeat protein
MFERADFKVIILIMLMAIILAVTAALAYFYLINRPEYPEGTYETVIEGETIIVESDPQQAVRLISTPVPEQPVAPEISSPPEGTGGSETGEIATVVPITPTAIVVTPLPVLPVTPLPATVVPPTAVPPRPNQHIFVDYQVVPGDTLWSVAGKHNTTIELMARYGIDATDIVPGTVIRLAVANPAYCPGTFPYVIRKGDTLSSIARKCGTTVENLMQINSIGPDFRLDATNVLCVPNPP